MAAHADITGPRRYAASPVSRWFRQWAAEQFAPAGITLDGAQPWDPQVRRERALRRIAIGGTLGAGEAYVDGDWDCAALDEFTARVLRVDADRPLTWRIAALADAAITRFVNLQNRAWARTNVTSHYDLGNALYATMLGRTMAYSCGYWRDASTLDEAQDAKYALICHKLGFRRGLSVLDIGCGWGGFAQYAATHYGVDVTGVTLSPAQATFAGRRCAGLPVDIRVQDYRDVCGRFDRVVSVGMFEHVGPANYETFFEIVTRLLANDGLFLLHSIGARRSADTNDPWIARYVFPHAVLPSAAQITRAIEPRFLIEDWHNFGADYDRTLMAWYDNVERGWSRLPDRYDDRFRRMWRYYLLTCAGMFRARRTQLWQLVLSSRGVRGGYRRVSA